MSENVNLIYEIKGLVQKCLNDAVKTSLTAYGSILPKIVNEEVQNNSATIKAIISESFTGLVADAEFKEQVITSVRHKIARELAVSFGDGAFKKHMESLKADPLLKARCVIAIENILEEGSKK